MNIPATVARAVDTAFSVAQSVTETVAFHAIDLSATYDPEVGATPITSSSVTVTMISAEVSQRELASGIVKFGDKWAYIRAKELPIEPKRDDFLIDSAGARWDVIGIKTEPTRTVWILLVRAAKS